MATQNAQVKVSVRDMEPVREALAKAAGREDALRELLSYCRTESTNEDLSEGEQLAYDDVVIRLTPILDGES